MLVLIRYPFRLATAVAGIAFAGILVLMQLSLQEALLRSSTMLIEKLNADIIMVSPSTTSLISLKPFPNERVPLAYADQNVVDAYTLTKSTITWRQPGTEELRFILGVGINPAKPVFLDQQIARQQKELTKKGRVLLDAYSRPEFGVAVAESALRNNQQAVFVSNNQRVHVAGFFRLGSSFAYESTVIGSIDTLNSLAPGSGNEAALGMIKLKAGSDAKKISSSLASLMPEDVTVITKKEFISLERRFWNHDKPIGFIFMFGSVMGLAVGCIMIYQTLSNSVASNLDSFAVMTCYGYSRIRLEAMVMSQGLILSLLSFPITAAVSGLLCRGIMQATRLPMSLSLLGSSATMFLMLLVSFTAALFAMARLEEADPCNLFG